MRKKEAKRSQKGFYDPPPHPSFLKQGAIITQGLVDSPFN